MTIAPATQADRRAAVGLVLVGIISGQLASALATFVFDEVGPAGTVFVRTVFAALALAAIWRPVTSGMSRTAIRDVGLFAVALSGMNLCFYESLDRLPLGIAVTLEFVGPLTIAVLGTRNRLDVLWVASAAAGILLLAPDIGDGVDAVGVALALMAGFFWGAYILMSARVGRGADGRSRLASAMLISAVLLLPTGLAEGAGALIDPSVLAVGFAVAILSSAIPYTVELEALRRLPERAFGVLLSLEPAIAAVVGLVVLDQHLATRMVVAIALIVIASAGALSSAEGVEVPES